MAQLSLPLRGEQRLGTGGPPGAPRPDPLPLCLCSGCELGPALLLFPRLPFPLASCLPGAGGGVGGCRQGVAGAGTASEAAAPPLITPLPINAPRLTTFAPAPYTHSSSAGELVAEAWGDAAPRPQRLKPPPPPTAPRPGAAPASRKSRLAQPSRSGAGGKWPRKDEASSAAARIAAEEIITSPRPCPPSPPGFLMLLQKGSHRGKERPACRNDQRRAARGALRSPGSRVPLPRPSPLPGPSPLRRCRSAPGPAAVRPGRGGMLSPVPRPAPTRRGGHAGQRPSPSPAAQRSPVLTLRRFAGHRRGAGSLARVVGAERGAPGGQRAAGTPRALLLPLSPAPVPGCGVTPRGAVTQRCP